MPAKSGPHVSYHFILIFFFGLFDNVLNFDTDLAVGCYRSNSDVHTTPIFAGSVDACVHECSSLFFR